MIDRFGDKIQVAWSFKEDEYLKAIIAMGEKTEHIRELAQETGRSVRTIRNRILTMRPAKTSFWKQGEDRILVAGKRNGLSCGQIAKKLGKTRNSVIGRVHRLRRLGYNLGPSSPSLRTFDDRRQFSDYVLQDYHRSHLSQTAEEIAEALRIPLETLLERAERAGIELERGRCTPSIVRGAALLDRLYGGAKVAKYVRKATASDRCGVEDRGFRNPFER